MKKILIGVSILCMGILLASCGGKREEPVQPPATGSSAEVPGESAGGIDYLVLVNKLHPLPDDWEEELETIHMTNSIGDDVEVEVKAYEAYLKLKEDLEKEEIFIDLDSARRSVADQERIMKDFTEQYGRDYALKTVAMPGYSEHHTGLALDLYLIIDGKDIVENEDMIQYPEIWAKIHEKLPEYGFILRYLKDKEHVTGYGYEPWHIRYLDDSGVAKEITEKGVTLEEYLGAAAESDPEIDLGDSGLFTREELEAAAEQIKCKFATYELCMLESLKYAGDEYSTEENLQRLKEASGNDNYIQCAKFEMAFRTPEQGYEDLEADREYTGYEWWAAREEGQGWDIVS